MRVLFAFVFFLTCCFVALAPLQALGPASAVELAIVEYAGRGAARPTAPARLA